MAQWGSDLGKLQYRGWGSDKMPDASVNDEQIQRYNREIMPTRQHTARPRCCDLKAPLLGSMDIKDKQDDSK